MKLIKKDSIWKPLFRRFRKFIKEIVNRNIDTISIEDKSVPERGQIYSEILNIPSELVAHEKNLYSLVLIIESRRMTQKRNIMPIYRDSLQPYFDAIRYVFFDFFYENSKTSRKRFFENHLIQFMWMYFIKESRNTFTTYFAQLKKSEQGPEKVEKFFEDVLMLSHKTGFQVLPMDLVTIISKKETAMAESQPVARVATQVLNRSDMALPLLTKYNNIALGSQSQFH